VKTGNEIIASFNTNCDKQSVLYKRQLQLN